MSAEKHEFRAEVQQLLDLMIHSLYSHKEIFLRELISNSSDAIDKIRYESLTNKDITEGDTEWKIKVIPDRDNGTLTVSDNGIGMDRKDVIEALGTIAHSGTQEFIAALQGSEVKDDPELIGQFGVGFYSSFMVADRVTVLSRKASEQASKAVKWESAADGSYTVEDIDKESRGTDVILHLNDDAKKYLEEWEIRSVVKRYSDYIEHPVVMDVERTKKSEIKDGETYTDIEEEVLNSRKAIWLKEKPDVSEDEYIEFYKHISHDFMDPLEVIHFKAEGTSEFSSLLYVPSHRPFDMFYKDYKPGPVLYVKRVQIMDHCEDLIPPYLRFIKGVVDSSDLPLNVSRELLQSNRQVELIKNSITKKVLDTLADLMQKDNEKYHKFYSEFGRVIKEGIHYDLKRREALADLLLFESTAADAGKTRTFKEYIEDMKDDQEEIYYITGVSREEVVSSPYLEVFKEKGYEVLFMYEEIDDIIMSSLSDYKGKKLKSVIKGDIDLDKKGEAEKEAAQKRYEKLIELLKDRLKDRVKDVRLSGRLRDSACCLVGEEGGMDPQMEKMLKAMGQDIPETKKVLEINPSHPLLESMTEIFEKDAKAQVLNDYARLMYEQSLVLEGSKPSDPSFFANMITKLMVSGLKEGKEGKKD
ncbi:MAG: molecular chaperone HtpG [Nitrospirota bacterium]|nr:MAG: molecular chaperone HtpG [Nitrospirota bacterium]